MGNGMGEGISELTGEVHPLAVSMARAQELGGFFALPQRQSDDSNWTSAGDLFKGDGQRLGDLVKVYGQGAWDSDNRHVAGSAFLVAYLSRVVFPVVGQYVMERRVPNVSLDNLSFHWNGAAIDATGLDRFTFAVLPDDAAANHADAMMVPDADAMYAQLKVWLFEGNLEAVIEDLRRAAGASVKVSWNAVAAAFSQALNRLYPTAGMPETVVQAAETFFTDPASPIYSQLTMEEFEHQGRVGFFSRRRGCCLWWRSPRANDYCSNCILVPQEQQDQRFREMLAGLR
jgi:ferric iron reductase protein FhuF